MLYFGIIVGRCTLEILKLYPEQKYYKRTKEVYTIYPSSDLEKKLNIHYSSTSNIRNRIINWLSNFNDESIKDSDLHEYMNSKKIKIDSLYLSILNILDNHSCNSEDEINRFSAELVKYKNSPDSIIFPIKNPYNDSNGLKRLILKCGYRERDFNFDKSRRFLFSDNNDISKTLVIVTDLILSGSQIEKAFNFYNYKFPDDFDFSDLEKFKDPSWSNREPGKERYFIFNKKEDSVNFRKNLIDFKKIIFLSPLISNKSKVKIIKLFKETFNLSAEIEFFSDSKNLIESDYIFDRIDISKQDYELFVKLLQDINLLDKLFVFETGQKKKYRKYICSNDMYKEKNLVLRIGSLPTKHLQLFSLKPKKGEPLLDYEGNWEY